MKRILCVCYGNTCRSPMLQALLVRELKSRGVEAVVESAGISEVGAPANEKAIICMKERGLDIISHRSRRVSDLNLPSYDHVFCASPAVSIVRTLIYLGVPKDRIGFAVASDPYGGDIEAYRACAEILAVAAIGIADNLAGN